MNFWGAASGCGDTTLGVSSGDRNSARVLDPPPRIDHCLSTFDMSVMRPKREFGTLGSRSRIPEARRCSASKVSEQAPVRIMGNCKRHGLRERTQPLDDFLEPVCPLERRGAAGSEPFVHIVKFLHLLRRPVTKTCCKSSFGMGNWEWGRGGGGRHER